MTKGEFDSKYPLKALTENQKKFLDHILFHHQGLGHPLAIIRISENGTYHGKKDVDLLNRVKKMYVLMAAGSADDLEEEYGKVTVHNKFNSKNTNIPPPREHFEHLYYEREVRMLKEKRLVDMEAAKAMSELMDDETIKQLIKQLENE